ncbi:MAG: ATP-binding cassette domain-containing protein [Oscillospiraceae bacterium]|nr:ATP-binding cassette domain-containing protein [Oscillospiraceae bacterium]
MSRDIFDQTTYYRQPEETHSAGSVRVTIFDGIAEPVELDLADFGKAVITFGREVGNDIQLRSHYVSRRHGQIRLVNGQCMIEDLDSRNGLIFNGESIRSRIVEDGDSIRIDDGVETTAQGVLMVFSRHDGESDWRTFRLANHMETTIGRDKGCDIVLDHVSVSKIHGKIIARGNAYYLVDHNSTNGIVVNGKKVEGKVQLHEKDVILITNSKLIFGGGKLSYCCFKKGISVDASHLVKKVDRNRKTICNDVSLRVNPCELVAIVGGSGAGKSTVMNCISGYSLPTEGRVAVNGVDLYENYDALKNIIGYVPQQDIVFDNLTVADMLGYAAELRLPKDFTEQERRDVVTRVIDSVELTAHREKMIKNLSGGQKKRASIAVELLSDPNLFFLDEPASGLDPGTERNLMATLKAMAVSGKTVIFVTHSTLNLGVCDKIVFMGAGGNLCFYGTHDEALQFFGVADIVDVYNLMTNNPQVYKDKYLREQKNTDRHAGQKSSAMPKQSTGHGWAQQVAVLCKRHLHIMRNDRIRLLLILLQAPLLGALIALVADGEQFVQFEITRSLLFAMACSAFWIGILNSIQEICKERNILKREYMTGLRLDSYISSKIFVMGLVCAVQAFLLTTVFVLLVGQPDQGVMFGAYLELLLTTFLTALGASAMGLFVSSLFKNADRAMTVAPLLLMPQLLFSGMIFQLEGASELISWFTVCRFTMQAYGTTADLNSLPTRLEQQGIPIEREAESFFTFSWTNFTFSLLMLCVFVVVFSILAGYVLRSIKRERN